MIERLAYEHDEDLRRDIIQAFDEAASLGTYGAQGARLVVTAEEWGDGQGRGYYWFRRKGRPEPRGRKKVVRGLRYLCLSCGKFHRKLPAPCHVQARSGFRYKCDRCGKIHRSLAPKKCRPAEAKAYRCPDCGSPNRDHTCPRRRVVVSFDRAPSLLREKLERQRERDRESWRRWKERNRPAASARHDQEEGRGLRGGDQVGQAPQQETEEQEGRAQAAGRR